MLKMVTELYASNGTALLEGADTCMDGFLSVFIVSIYMI